MSSWTVMGYDVCVHMCEETIEADRSGGRSFLSVAPLALP